jgi:hypothetical protein
VLGNNIDVEENKRVVGLEPVVRKEALLTPYTDLLETRHDFLPIKGRNPVFRDQRQGSHQCRASIRRWDFSNTFHFLINLLTMNVLVIARNALAQEESEEFSGDFSDPINIHIENDRDGCAC